MKKNIKFEQISQNESKFTFNGMKFLLEEKKVGFSGLGRCVNIYGLDGITKTFVKCVGWTKTDNHGGPSKDCITSTITSFENCKGLAVAYLTKLLK
jgi:hypothetical protein